MLKRILIAIVAFLISGFIIFEYFGWLVKHIGEFWYIIILVAVPLVCGSLTFIFGSKIWNWLGRFKGWG